MWMMSEDGGWGYNGSFLDKMVSILCVPTHPQEDEEYLEILEWHKKQPAITNHAG